MPYYLCDNFGKCNLADAGEPIELPPGAEPICPEPTCHGPLSPAGNSNSDPVFLASLDARDGGKRRVVFALGAFVLLVAGLVGGVAYLLISPAGPETLILDVPSQVIASVGESVQIPVTVRPPAADNVTLTVEGKLPPGMVLDEPGRRLNGTVQSPGAFPLVLHAASPRFAPGSAATTLVVKENRDVSPKLSLWVEPRVLGRVGESLEVPIGIGPAGMEGVTLSVQGDLPAGLFLDDPAKRLYGTPKKAGSSDVVFIASAPGYAPASAPVNFTILAAKSSPMPMAGAEFTPNPPVQVAPALTPAAQAGESPVSAARTEIVPNVIKPSPTPAGAVSDASEDLLAEPTLADQATPELRNALRRCDRVTLNFQFDRREFDTLDRSSMQNLNRLAAFLRKPGMSKRHLVVVGCTDGTGTRSQNNFFARSRAQSFAAYLEEAGIKNPIDEMLGSSGDYLVLRKDSSGGDPESNRRVDVYLKK